MSTRTYDAKKVLVTVGGVIMEGFGDSEKITATRYEDAFTLKMGTDGDGTRSKNNNKSGSFTIPLMQTSPSNDVLSGFAALDELSNSGIVPVLVKEVGSLTTLFSGQAWIKKVPDYKAAKEADVLQWVLDCTSMDVFIGGLSAD